MQQNIPYEPPHNTSLFHDVPPMVEEPDKIEKLNYKGFMTELTEKKVKSMHDYVNSKVSKYPVSSAN